VGVVLAVDAAAAAAAAVVVVVAVVEEALVVVFVVVVVAVAAVVLWGPNSVAVAVALDAATAAHEQPPRLDPVSFPLEIRSTRRPVPS